MGGNPNPAAVQYAGFPDPDLIEALAQQWLGEGAVLGGLAVVVGGSAEVVWSGEARAAAAVAAAGVAGVVGQSAANATALGQALAAYAAVVRQEIKEADEGDLGGLGGI